MLIFRRIICSVCLMALSLGFAQSVKAIDVTEITPEKLADIKTSCVAMQGVLQKIQYNDAANRVNRGQGYESLVTRMILPMNSRVAVNGLSTVAATLATTTTHYQQALENFKNDYDKYDDALTASLRIKCQDKPIEFYQHLTNARERRTNVSEDIIAINKTIEEYRQTVIKLKANY